MMHLLVRNMSGLLLIILSFVNSASTTEKMMCTGNHTLLEAPGDAVISAFVDTNYGPYCNESTRRSYQEVSTALYVVQTLNKYDYVPGLSLGLKIFDTCHDGMSVYKQALMEAVNSDCVDYYELGILVPVNYGKILEPFNDYDILPVTFYKDANMTKALVDTLIEFISTKFEVIDLLLVETNRVLDLVMDATREAGICVKRVEKDKVTLDNDTEAVIVVVGSKDSLNSWIGMNEDDGQKTWIVLPLDNSDVNEILPHGSYVVKSESFESFDLFQEFPSVDQFLDTSEDLVIHSPYLLSIGKAIVQIARVLGELQRRNCPHGTTCELPRFDEKRVADISHTEVYEALHILPKSHSVKYTVSRRSDPDTEDLFRVASYDIDVVNFQPSPESVTPKMPKLCVKKLKNKCRKCANFKIRLDARAAISKDNDNYTGNNTFLKPGILIPIFLTVMSCGTVASIVVLIFIIYRYFADRILDGNPTLTILLVVANIFVLQTILPFSINDDYLLGGKEYINSRKILVSTLSIGILFSIMLSRSFFLALSSGGVFMSHINGYLQGLMVFFMAGVQVAISTMYFLLSTADSAHVVRSLTFIALLGYDIFLLIVLFVVCCFIAQIQRNYREGKCFFGTVIGLVVTWAVWITCYVLVEYNIRDTVVSFGIIATSYLIIIGILIPRTYYMVTNSNGGKDFLRRFETTDLGPDPRTSTLARQTRRPFYDYVHPMESITGGLVSQMTRYPNYYGNSSPNPHYQTGSCGRVLMTDPTRLTAYNNYGYHPDMQEVENPYVVPRVCVENPEGCRNAVSRGQHQERGEVCYAQPGYPTGRQKIAFRDHPKDCIETDVYVEGRHLSPNKRGPNESYPSRCPSPKLYQTEETIREEDEDRDITRITRL